MLRFSEKKAFGGCKGQIFVIGNQIAGREDKIGEPGRRSIRLGDDFDWLEVGWEAILRIRRLRRSVCGVHGCSRPLLRPGKRKNGLFSAGKLHVQRHYNH